jgi:hypothetical protein
MVQLLGYGGAGAGAGAVLYLLGWGSVDSASRTRSLELESAWFSRPVELETRYSAEHDTLVGAFDSR